MLRLMPGSGSASSKVLVTFRLMVLAAVDNLRLDLRFHKGLQTSSCLVLASPSALAGILLQGNFAPNDLIFLRWFR